jgi:hypothetical protein
VDAIKQIKDEKRKLEEQIFELIAHFEADSDIRVGAVELYRVQYAGDRSKLFNVTLGVNIEDD